MPLLLDFCVWFSEDGTDDEDVDDDDDDISTQEDDGLKKVIALNVAYSVLL